MWGDNRTVGLCHFAHEMCLRLISRSLGMLRIDSLHYVRGGKAKLRNPICRCQPRSITVRRYIQIILPGPGPLICWWRDLSREIATRYALFARIPLRCHSISLFMAHSPRLSSSPCARGSILSTAPQVSYAFNGEILDSRESRDREIHPRDEKILLETTTCWIANHFSDILEPNRDGMNIFRHVWIRRIVFAIFNSIIIHELITKHYKDR